MLKSCILVVCKLKQFFQICSDFTGQYCCLQSVHSHVSLFNELGQAVTPNKKYTRGKVRQFSKHLFLVCVGTKTFSFLGLGTEFHLLELLLGEIKQLFGLPHIPGLNDSMIGVVVSPEFTCIKIQGFKYLLIPNWCFQLLKPDVRNCYLHQFDYLQFLLLISSVLQSL